MIAVASASVLEKVAMLSLEQGLLYQLPKSPLYDLAMQPTVGQEARSVAVVISKGNGNVKLKISNY